MATYTITPNEANTLTGLKSSVVGWHFTAATIADVFGGMTLIRRGGWNPIIEADPTNDGLWIMRVTQGGQAPIVVQDTDWFTFDGFFVRIVTQADMDANHTAVLES